MAREKSEDLREDLRDLRPMASCRPAVMHRLTLVIIAIVFGNAAAMATASAVRKNAALKALRKPRGLSVSVEIVPRPSCGEEDLRRLSMKLRDINAATLFVSDLHTLSVLASEQSSAKGNFPGPCPLVFAGAPELAQQALSDGASAVVLDAGQDKAREGIAPDHILWRVQSEDEAQAVISHGATSFIFDGDVCNLSAGLEALAPGAVAVANIEAMQAGNQEIDAGRRAAGAGCRSLMLRGACVGDEEDLPYTRFAIDGLTSKMSTEFKIDGMTGAINGHFGSSGGSLSRRANGDVQWKRTVS